MILALFLLFFAAEPKERQAADFEVAAKQAAQARDSNRTPEAIRLYRRALDLQPAWAEGWWRLGSLFYETDQHADAAAAFARFLKLEKESAPGWTMLGLCEYKLRNYEAAMRDLLAGKAFGLPDSNQMAEVARYHRALLYTHFKQYEPALDELKHFSVPAVEGPGIIEATGVAALRMSMLPEELPGDMRPFVMKTGRAVFDSWAARAADADREFRDLILLHPDDPNLHYLYGSFLIQGHPDDGLRELNKCLELDARYVPAMLQIAFEALSRGEPSEGIPHAANAVKLDPDSFVAHNALGRLLMASGDTARATGELEKAVQLAPGNPECRFALASAYTKAGRKQDAARENAEFLRLKKLRGAPEDQ